LWESGLPSDGLGLIEGLPQKSGLAMAQQPELAFDERAGFCDGIEGISTELIRFHL
jgi:hypothetical protein